jgi:hypothetical protein
MQGTIRPESRGAHVPQVSCGSANQANVEDKVLPKISLNNRRILPWLI